jgi:hypothetical protein
MAAPRQNEIMERDGGGNHNFVVARLVYAAHQGIRSPLDYSTIWGRASQKGPWRAPSSRPRSRGIWVVAGGCVRDLLLGREPSDYDVATSAAPGEILRLFRQGPRRRALWRGVVREAGRSRSRQFRRDIFMEGAIRARSSSKPTRARMCSGATSPSTAC